MGYDTKPNLDYSKFEQRSGDTLNLSGNTKIFKYFSIESGSTLVIKPNSGYGKVLTSDNNGVITLQSLADGIVHGDNIYTTISNSCYITTSCANILFGCDAGEVLINGNNNIGIGWYSLNNNTIGSENIAIGTCTLLLNVCGCSNIALGFESLYNNVLGCNNIGIGDSTLFSNISGLHNIGIGDSVLVNNTSGNDNTAIGFTSLPNNTYGCDNVGIGESSLFSNIIGCDNVGIGESSLFSNIIGCDNVGIGNYAGYYATGSSNVFIGKFAGYCESSSNRLHIANNANKSLITGEFDNEKLCIRGKTYISGLTNASKLNALYYDTFTNEITYGIASGSTSSVTAANGLTKIGDTIILGGTLTGDTTITYGDITTLKITNTGNTTFFKLYNDCIEMSSSNNGCITNGCNDIWLQSNSNTFIDIFGQYDSEDILLQSNSNTYIDILGQDCFEDIQIHANTNAWIDVNGCANNEMICINANSASLILSELNSNIFNDSTKMRGLEYAADYSANYTDRSLIDKGYVVSILSGITGTTFSNGLTKANNNVSLGGTLSSSVTIETGNYNSFVLSGSTCNAICFINGKCLTNSGDVSLDLYTCRNCCCCNTSFIISDGNRLTVGSTYNNCTNTIDLANGNMTTISSPSTVDICSPNINFCTKDNSTGFTGIRLTCCSASICTIPLSVVNNVDNVYCNVLYLGYPNADNTWRFVVSGSSLIMQRLVPNCGWLNKQVFN